MSTDKTARIPVSPEVFERARTEKRSNEDWDDTINRLIDAREERDALKYVAREKHEVQQ